MSQPWTDTVTFSGAKSRGLGLNFLPRGLYKVVSNDPENTVSPKKSTPCYLLHHKVIDSRAADAQGNIPLQGNDGLQVNAEFDDFLMKPVPGIDPEQNERNEAGLKTALVAFGAAAREAMDQATGQVNVRYDHFHGKTAWLIYDPPDGTDPDDTYPAIWYLRPDDAADILTGKRRPKWPKDSRNSRRRTSVQGVGGGGSMTTGQAVAGTQTPPPGFASRQQAGTVTPPQTNPAAADVAGLAGATPDNGIAQPTQGQAPQSW